MAVLLTIALKTRGGMLHVQHLRALEDEARAVWSTS
jgi:hypothetical protein